MRAWDLGWIEPDGRGTNREAITIFTEDQNNLTNFHIIKSISQYFIFCIFGTQDPVDEAIDFSFII